MIFLCRFLYFSFPSIFISFSLSSVSFCPHPNNARLARTHRVLMTQENSVSTQRNQSAAESQLRLRDPLMGAGQLRATRTRRDRSISVHSICRRINCYGLEGKQMFVLWHLPMCPYIVRLCCFQKVTASCHRYISWGSCSSSYTFLFASNETSSLPVCPFENFISETTELVMNNFDIWWPTLKAVERI
jgi:hypothetical protein